MLKKPKFIYRIAALLFTGAITAASLVGCGYGTQHVTRQDSQDKKPQKEQSLTNGVKVYKSQTNNKTDLSK